MKLSELPNIGKVLEQRLASIGIETGEQLEAAGSKDAFARLRVVYDDACLNTLCALEGAVQGIRWHHLSDEVKADLKEYFAAQNRFGI